MSSESPSDSYSRIVPGLSFIIYSLACYFANFSSSFSFSNKAFLFAALADFLPFLDEESNAFRSSIYDVSKADLSSAYFSSSFFSSSFFFYFTS